jgi:hypothetical protein
MTAPTGAFVLKDAIVKFGATTFTNQVTKARLVPDVNRETLRTLVPDGIVQDVTTTWTLELSGVQDWETGGLAAYMNTNAGSTVTAVIAPRTGSGKQQATVSVLIQPVDFGGEQGNWNTFDATLGVVGTPTFAAQP